MAKADDLQKKGKLKEQVTRKRPKKRTEKEQAENLQIGGLVKPGMSAEKIKAEFDKLFPNPKCELVYSTPYELLVAVVLSAQCTDRRVNLVTRELFKKYNTPSAMLTLSLAELESFVRPCGFYHNKAKNILSMSRDLVEKFDGKVPSDIDALQTLAGVGRKTANVVYAEAFKGAAIAVDTHVLRVSNRLGIVQTDDPFVCEKALSDYFPKKYWSELHLQMVLFGRYKCKSVRPECEGCPFYDICRSEKKFKA